MKSALTITLERKYIIMITSGTSTLGAFFSGLPRDTFMVVEKDDEGTTIYPIEDILFGVPSEDPSWDKEVVVLWNESATLALVAQAESADPRCYTFKDKKAILVAEHQDVFDICDPDEFKF